uniref:Uncharacterized protein n=1 Tax=Cannabis sativa TaxID=3483 RepID=A0A803PSS5_CANSA
MQIRRVEGSRYGNHESPASDNRQPFQVGRLIRRAYQVIGQQPVTNTYIPTGPQHEPEECPAELPQQTQINGPSNPRPQGQIVGQMVDA